MQIPAAPRTVVVPAAGVQLPGDLTVPGAARGVVVFAHGRGSSRRSPRNRQVAAALQVAGFGTLLMDLLTAAEADVDAATRELRFDIPLLAGRLTAAADWLDTVPEAAGLPLADFGASTGAAAALITAADLPDRVRAVVSRGGRPDLAGDALGRVRAPTLLVVGGADPQVLRLNREAAARLAAEHEVAVVPGATHLFPEPGALEQVIDRSVRWLDRWLPRSPGGQPSGGRRAAVSAASTSSSTVSGSGAEGSGWQGRSRRSAEP
jgi:dienelactone hydrolase